MSENKKSYKYFYNPITGKKTNHVPIYPEGYYELNNHQEHNLREFLMWQLADSFARENKGTQWERCGIRNVGGVDYIVQVRWVERRRTCDGHDLHTSPEECEKYDGKTFYETRVSL